MATSVYISQKVVSEQNLYEDLIIESLKIYGQDVYYLPRNIVERDYVFGEAVESQFDDAYIIESYIENTEGFEGEGNLLSKFGLEIRDQATFIVSRRRWEQAVGQWESEQIRPNEGDLIYLPLSKSMFQIDHVEHESPFYQLSNLPTYKLQCSMFEFGEETFKTGINDIDAVETVFNTRLKLTLSGLIEGATINLGDTVSQTISDVDITAEVVSRSDIISGGATINVINVKTSDGLYHEFLKGQNITVGNNICTLVSFNQLGSVDGSGAESTYAANDTFEREANEILDFSEANPFGEPGGF